MSDTIENIFRDTINGSGEMSYADKVSQAQRCHYNSQCEECGMEVDNAEDGCTCLCHDLV